jgi:hypothetical protein
MATESIPARPRPPLSRAVDVIVLLMGATYCVRRWVIDDANPNLEPLSAGAVVLGPLMLAGVAAWFWGLRGRPPIVVRRVTMWTLVIAACLAAVTLVFSLGWSLGWRGELWNISVADGMVEFAPSGGAASGLELSGRGGGPWRWWFEYRRSPTSIFVGLPLWVMVVATAAPGVGIWLIGRTPRR